MTERPAFIHTAESERRSCPSCQRILDAATGVSLDPNDPRPQMAPGDITVCAYCGLSLVVTALSFDHPHGFRVAADADLDRLPPELRLLHESWKPFKNRPQ